MRLFLHYSTLFRQIPHGCVNIACEDGHFSERSVYEDAALHRYGRVIGADRAEMCGKCAPEGRNARKLPQFARKSGVLRRFVYLCIKKWLGIRISPRPVFAIWTRMRRNGSKN